MPTPFMNKSQGGGYFDPAINFLIQMLFQDMQQQRQAELRQQQGGWELRKQEELARQKSGYQMQEELFKQQLGQQLGQEKLEREGADWEQGTRVLDRYLRGESLTPGQQGSLYRLFQSEGGRSYAQQTGGYPMVDAGPPSIQTLETQGQPPTQTPMMTAPQKLGGAVFPPIPPAIGRTESFAMGPGFETTVEQEVPRETAFTQLRAQKQTAVEKATLDARKQLLELEKLQQDIKQGKVLTLPAEVNAELGAMGIRHPNEATPGQIQKAIGRVETKLLTRSREQGLAAANLKEGTRVAQVLPPSLAEMMDAKTVGEGESKGYVIPEIRGSEVRGLSAQRGLVKQAVEMADRMRTLLDESPEAHGVSGTLTSLAGSIIAQVENLGRVTSKTFGIEFSVPTGLDAYQKTFREMGITNRVLQSEYLSLAFLIGATEGLRGRELTSRMIELILRKIGVSGQDPRAFQAVLTETRNDLLNAYGNTVESVLQKAPVRLPLELEKLRQSSGGTKGFVPPSSLPSSSQEKPLLPGVRRLERLK